MVMFTGISIGCCENLEFQECETDDDHDSGLNFRWDSTLKKCGYSNPWDLLDPGVKNGCGHASNSKKLGFLMILGFLLVGFSMK